MKTPGTKRRDIFHHNPARLNLANDSEVLEPKTRAASPKAGSQASSAEVLTRTPTHEHVNGLDIGSAQLSDVGVAGDAGPVLGEDPLTELVLLAEPDGLEASGPVEAKIEAPNSAEE